jgi:hypothetical protein
LNIRWLLAWFRPDAAVSCSTDTQEGAVPVVLAAGGGVIVETFLPSGIVVL